jgi:hypothetical protein
MEQLGNEIRASLRTAGVPDVGVLADVTRVWPEAVGETIAAAAWPARIGRDGTLHVHAASSIWAFELTTMAAVVLEHLAGSLGRQTPPRLRFTVGPIPDRTSPGAAPIASGTPAAVRPSASARRDADALAVAVEDERLRELVRRAAAASLTRPPDDRPIW